MPNEDAITQWLEQLHLGEQDAFQQIWDRYFSRLCGVAKKKLPQYVRREFDEEDIALSAIDCLYRGIEEGKFSELQNRSELWALLVLITTRKVSHRLRDRSVAKRGGDKQVQFDTDDVSQLEKMIAREPTPDFILQINEEANNLLQLLTDLKVRKTAELKIAGYSNDEIAKSLSCGKRTVERRLMIVRKIWTEANFGIELEEDDPNEVS